MHPQTLRMYESRGLVRPRRTPAARAYSDADLDRIRRVTQLATGLGISLQGAEYVFGLEDARTLSTASASSRRRSTTPTGAPRAHRRGAPLVPPRHRRLGATPAPGSSLVPQDHRSTIDRKRPWTSPSSPSRPRRPCRARRGARAMGNPEVTAPHLLLALIAEADSVADTLLASRGRRHARAPRRGRVRPRRAARARAAPPSRSRSRASRFRSVLERAEREAKELGDDYVATERLVIALAEERGRARERLQAHRRHEGQAARGAALRARRPARERSERRGPLRRTDEVAVDLTARAGAGKVDPVIGRDDEIRRIVQVLSRRTKNNPVLIGDPGVGKTAISRGPRPADRAGRRARVAEGPAGVLARRRRAPRRLEVPRRVRGAAEGRARRDHRRRGPDRAVHRRAAHDRRRRRGGGRRRRGEPPEADARARRAACDRRDDARRVPQARREGRGARAALPARARRRAVGRGHDRHPARPQGALRGAPRRPHPGRRDRLGGVLLRPLHRRTASCPTRRST